MSSGFRSNLLILTASLALCLLAAEIVVRFYIFGTSALSYSGMRSFQSFGKSGLIKASEHQQLLFEFRPGLNELQQFAPFVTNSAGMRDSEYSLEKPPGTFRVAVLGDSFTAGAGVSIDQTYHSLIEQRLRNTPDGRRYEFINFAVHGYYLNQYPAMLKLKALAYRPDLVLVGYCEANDADIPPAMRFQQPYSVKSRENGFFTSYLWKLIKTFQKSEERQNRNLDLSTEQLTFIDEQFAELRQLSIANNIPVVLASLSNYPVNTDRIKELAVKNNLPFIDTSPAFSNTEPAKHRAFLVDHHPNAAAHTLFADTIQEELTKLGYLPKVN